MFKTLAKFIKLTFKINPLFYLISFLQAILNVSKMFIGVYAVKWIIDLVLTASYEQTVRLAITVVLIQIGLLFLTKLLDQVLRVVRFELRYDLNRYVTSRVMRLEYEKLEDPYFLDLRERAKFAIDNQGVTWMLLEYMTTFTSSIISILSLGLILFFFDWIMIVVLLGALVFHVLIFNMSNKFQLTLTNNMIPINRRFGYYLSTLLNVENQKDYRFTNLNKLVHEKTSEFTNESIGMIEDISMGMSKFSYASDVINYAVMGFSYIYIAIKTLANIIPISDFILYTGTTIQLGEQLASVVGDRKSTRLTPVT